MPRRSKTDQELGFVKSWWVVVQGIESGYGKMVTLVVMPTSRQGVFQFRMSAMDLGDETLGIGRTDMVANLYPNGHSQDLAAFLWTMALKLEDVIIDGLDNAAQGRKPGA